MCKSSYPIKPYMSLYYYHGEKRFEAMCRNAVTTFFSCQVFYEITFKSKCFLCKFKMDTLKPLLTVHIDQLASEHAYLPPEVVRGAYFHGRGVFLGMKYFSECTYICL